MPNAESTDSPGQLGARSSKNSKANRIETGERSGGIPRNLFGGSRRKIAKKIADHRVMRSSDGEGRSIRSDALYPALSGEWEVPVTRNAKITPVNEGVGGGVGGPPLPPSSPFKSILERGRKSVRISSLFSLFSFAIFFDSSKRIFPDSGVPYH